MTPDTIPAALYAAAVLSSFRESDPRTSARIIACVSPFDINSAREARNALERAFHLAGTPSPRVLESDRLRTAASVSGRWLKKNILVMTRQNLAASGRNLGDIPEAVFAFGDPAIARSEAAAILNSRKPRRVTRGDSWIAATRSLVRYAKQEKLTVISSYGTTPYCIASRLSLGMPLIVVCDDVLPFMFPEREELFFSKYGDLFRYDSTLFISPFPPGTRTPRNVRCEERDAVVAALASVLLVGEIRPGGNMERIIGSRSGGNVKIIRHTSQDGDRGAFQATVSAGTTAGTTSPARPIAASPFGKWVGKSSYVIHYTRSCPGPWPGQTVADYCLSLIQGCERSAHTGFDTLLRILDEKLIRASSRLMRGAHAVVSFTECPPEELSTLIRWRKGLIRWSFEPYGIGFPKEDLFSLGARPVIYAVEQAFQDLSDDLQYLFQLQAGDRADWSGEKEWRVRGDLVLTESLREKMVVIVPTPEEADVIAREFGCAVTLSESDGHSKSV